MSRAGKKERRERNPEMDCWLVKSDPDTYTWDDLVRLGRDHWDGVRNYAARNHLREMKVGDEVLFYHSGEERVIIGTAKVVRESFPDPTTADDRWVAVDLEPISKFTRPVSLQQIKSEKGLQEMSLLRISRLSVHKVARPHFDQIVELGG